MEWSQIWTLVGINAALFGSNMALLVWFRGESRSDWKHCDTILKAIQDEIKDFHGRLCAIEERNKEKK